MEDCKPQMKDKSGWARERRKQARIEGRPYVNSKGKLVEARQMGSDCGCRRKCFAKVPLTVRAAIFNEFYRLGSYDEQNAYLYKLIRRGKPSRQRGKDPAKARGNSYQYFVGVHGVDVQVCREAFAHIHAVSAHKIRILCRKMERNVAYPRDERGKHDNRKKTPSETLNKIRSHIRSLVESGRLQEFVREPAGAGMNICKMWKDFLKHYDARFAEYVISKKSWITLKTGEIVDPLAKHWIYSKVFHEEFEEDVNKALSQEAEQFPLPEAEEILDDGVESTQTHVEACVSDVPSSSIAPVNLLMEPSMQAQILQASPDQYVVVPVTITQMPLSCFANIVVADFRPSFIA
ncbi:unnamed protein product [Notodromas monacha]|uniref:Uncharacterized protein n=1 Tax=Notodromas monacha TaxID=399045 RepID=A0A7R9BI01_9CRUS|nr:unnamed protein product [Notodromas monacha]CAG0915861.1 unnamed protein product [Notodromas monacha]